MHILITLKPSIVLALSSDMALDQRIALDLAQIGIELSPLSAHYNDASCATHMGFLLGFSGAKEETMVHIVVALEHWFEKKLG
ncbi:MAG: hypothetical protein ACTH58_03780 [Marinomonas foliarum]